MKLKFIAIMFAALFAACSSGGEEADGGTGGGTEGGTGGGTEGGTGGSTEGGGSDDAFADSFPEENDEIKFEEEANKYGVTLSGDVIYVDAENGDDSNSGDSPANAIKTLSKLAGMTISSGDQILLCGGQTHAGSIVLEDISNANGWIHVGSYGSQKARIDAAGKERGILIKNTSNVIVSDVKISANGGTGIGKSRYGIYISANGGTMDDIILYNVDIRDIFYFSENDPNIPTDRPCRTWDANGSDYYGYGIVGVAGATSPTTYLNDVTIEECNVRDVSNMGYQFRGGDWNGGKGEVHGLKITSSTGINIGGPGSNFWSIFDSEMTNCKFSYTGDPRDPRNWGRGSCMWLINCKNVLFEGNLFENASGIADSCGAHIDLDNENVVIQRCLSRNNAGGFIELLGGNKNCAYRYNISIDDGWRNSNDLGQYSYWGWDASNHSATPGVLMSISGYFEGEQFVGPYQSYIYNNTIVLNEKRTPAGYTNPMKFEIATTTRGLVVANNIFWVPEKMNVTSNTHTASGGTYENAFDFKKSDNGSVRYMTEAEIDAMDITIDNNLFEVYNPKFENGSLSLPENYWCDGELNGDPGFKNVAGTSAEDMIPTNSAVINSGIAIEQLSTDAYGLKYGDGNGLTLNKDFFGNTITSPIVGAVVCQ